MSLPKKILPCPIIDALIEIRFSTGIHPSAVFGVIYNTLAKNYPKIDKLPILQVPEPIREADSSFKYKPYFKASNDTFIVQIGPDVFTISSFPQYAGWDKFSIEIFSLIKTIKNLNIVTAVHRLGIRYINFFPVNIFENINLEILCNDTKISGAKTHLRTEFLKDDFKSTLQLTNDFIHNSVPGSIIDIDTFKDKNLDSFFNLYEDLIHQGHLKEKELFFSLLSADFLASLQPEY
jgi:uncharacterized protein (TIGR04255 family)